jgi:hypothetical protein
MEKKEIINLMVISVFLFLAAYIIQDFDNNNVIGSSPKIKISGGEGSYNSVSCIDVDNGINYYIKGTCKDRYSISYDFCLKDSVYEFYCAYNITVNENTCFTNLYECPNGCFNGECT